MKRSWSLTQEEIEQAIAEYVQRHAKLENTKLVVTINKGECDYNQGHYFSAMVIEK